MAKQLSGQGSVVAASGRVSVENSMARTGKRLAASIKPEPEAEAPDGKPSPERYLNRELSWLEFNRRVLHEAEDARTPLLERVRFLEIFSSNLDEFVMKRVGLLKRRLQAGVLRAGPDGMTPARQVAAVRKSILELTAYQAKVLTTGVLPALADKGIRIVRYDQLTDAQRQEAEQFFRREVFPVLTPLAVDPGHPFPFISNLSTSLGVVLRHPDTDDKLFARIKVPEVLPFFIRLTSQKGASDYVFLSLLDLIEQHLADLFPGMVVTRVMPFRVTRDAEVEGAADDADDLLEMVEQEVRQRKFEHVVRLEHAPQPDPWMLQFLMQELELSGDDLYEQPALLHYRGLKAISELHIPELRYEPWNPVTPKALGDGELDLFSIVRRGDVVVHHPYESFSASIERFVRGAAADPDVLAIKITLYRTGNDSPFIPALIQAAEQGKQVVAVVELKARFDEEQNIYLAQALEKAGVHVVYGMLGLKTHTKIVLVVRKEQDGLRCYSHIGTGNYHIHTARLYTDVSLLTCRADLAEDLVDLFHFLTGRSLKQQYRKLLVAPVNMSERFLALIESEAANRRAGKPARIVAKMNSLEDVRIMEALYRAAQALAFVEGRPYCIPDDFKRLVLPVLAHRCIVNSRYVSTLKKSDQAEAILKEIAESTPVPL